VNGHDIVGEPGKVRSSIGLTGQYAAVDDYLTGRENIEMIGRLYRLSDAEAKKRSQELLEKFDLVGDSNRPVRTYSGGMRRRIDLAMSLIASPPILFLDEPTTGLDPRSRLTMWEIIKELAATDVTILLTTQYMEEADNLADRIIVIDRGKVIAEGTPSELKAKVGSDHLEFIISESSNFDNAAKVLNQDGIRIEAKERSISLPTKNGAKDLKQALSRLEEAGVEVESLSLHRPTLDDVFLTITGHGVEEEENKKL
jgi:ABC-2 type transport system ATP-binding protein